MTNLTTFKVYWKEGEPTLLTGINLADALNTLPTPLSLGDLSSIAGFSEVQFPDASQVETGQFCCMACKGGPQVVECGEEEYVVQCADCGAMPISVMPDPQSAQRAWNEYQLSVQRDLVEDVVCYQGPLS